MKQQNGHIGEIELARLSLSAAEEGIAWINQAGLITWSNEAFQKIIQSSPEILHSKNITQVLKLFQKGKAVCEDDYPHARAFKNKEEFSESYETIIEGEEKNLKIISNFIFNSEPYVILICNDETALKKMEQENSEKMAMLTHAGRLISLGEMATSIAHELNQPLAIIRTNMQTLEILSQDETASQDLKEIITVAIRQVDRATAIIDHIRGFARKKGTSQEAIDLRVPTESALSMFNEQFRLHEINIVRSYDEDLPNLPINEQEFEQLIINLLANARYALEEKYKKYNQKYERNITIRLAYEEARQQVICSVMDNGIGMTAEVLEHCQEPFYTTKAPGDGTGLGLSIIGSILKNFNGTVTIESMPDQGTTIQITLPLKEGQGSNQKEAGGI